MRAKIRSAGVFRSMYTKMTDFKDDLTDVDGALEITDADENFTGYDIGRNDA